MAVGALSATEALAELGRIRLGENRLEEVLARIADLAKMTIPGTKDVSLTLLEGGVGVSAAYTSESARELDELQCRQGRGPCLDASVSGGSISVPDTAHEPRWPAWAAHARSLGISSSLSIGLPIQDAVVGAMNVHSGRPHAFDANAKELASTFAAYAAVALANAHSYESTATLAQQMQEAMRSRAVIEQAKGIVMGERRCTPDEAFALLSKVSQDCNRKLRDVAAELVGQASRSADTGSDGGPAAGGIIGAD